MQHRFITFVELARTVYENRRGRMQQMICRILHFTVVAEKEQHPPAACPRLDFPPFLLTSPVALLVSPFDLFHHLHGVLSPPLYSYCGWLHVVMDMNSGYQRFVRYASSFGVIPLLARIFLHQVLTNVVPAQSMYQEHQKPWRWNGQLVISREKCGR